VTEMSRSVRGEVVASTFDEPAEPPRAGRRDGDREGEAPGRAQEGRGDPARLDHPPGARLQHRGARVGESSSPAAAGRRECAAEAKRFFGAARHVEEGGSLTIIATALIDTAAAWTT